MNKDFDGWNTIKKHIDGDINTRSAFPREREVWMSVVGENIGYEQSGSGTNFSRPVVIVKKFNDKMFWGVPLSSKQKLFDFYYNFTDPSGESVSAILAQMRLMSSCRLDRLLYELPKSDFNEIRSRLIVFLQSKPRTGRGFSAPPRNGGSL